MPIRNIRRSQKDVNKGSLKTVGGGVHEDSNAFNRVNQKASFLAISIQKDN